METVPKGTDKQIDIQLLEDDEETVVPVSDFTGILVYLVLQSSRTVISKYSLGQKQDFGDVEVLDSANGEIRVRLQSAATKDLEEEGFVYYEIKVSETDVDFDNDNFYTAYISPVILNIVPAESADGNPD